MTPHESAPRRIGRIGLYSMIGLKSRVAKHAMGNSALAFYHSRQILPAFRPTSSFVTTESSAFADDDGFYSPRGPYAQKQKKPRRVSHRGSIPSATKIVRD